MRQVRVEDAVGQVLCHDMTQIIPGKSKGPRFRKGHVVKPEDIPVLLSMGKRNLYVFELAPGQLHENDAAERLAALCVGPGCERAGGPSEGKIGIRATRDGVLLVDSEHLVAVNSCDEVMVATRRGNFGVRAGDMLAGTRVIPLVVGEKVVETAERAAAGGPLLRVEPYRVRTAAVVATGSEVASGLIEDAFTPVIESKLADYGVEVTCRSTPGDDPACVEAAIREAVSSGCGMVVCTGGMSVDPDDNTPGAIRRAGARVVAYGSPVLPGAMLLVGYFDDVAGASVPVCAMYNKATVLDLGLPRVLAGVELTRRDLAAMGEGGLCLGCKPCTFPHCSFGR